jgi:hypothetical protein
MEIGLIEVCVGLVTGFSTAAFAARHRVSFLLPPRSFFIRVLGREDE